jgi:hypothetical protein
MKRIGIGVAAVIAALGLWANPASAVPVSCSPGPPFPTAVVIQPQGATTIPQATVNIYGQPGFVAVRGTDNAAWIQQFTTTTTSPQWSASWASLGGGLASYPKLVTQSGATRLYALGSDLSTYYRTFSFGAWGPWTAHSVGAGYFNSLPTQTVVNWGVWNGSGVRTFWLQVGVFWTAPTASCFYQDS